MKSGAPSSQKTETSTTEKHQLPVGLQSHEWLVFPYVGIIQMRFQVKTNKVSSHLVIMSDDVVIMDMEAGLGASGKRYGGEHGPVCGRNQNPAHVAYRAYKKVKTLATDLGVKQVRVVANKVRGPEDEEYIRERIPAEDLLGFVHYSSSVIDADRRGESPFDYDKNAVEEIRQIKKILDESDK